MRQAPPQVRRARYRLHPVRPAEQPLDAEELKAILPLKEHTPLHMEDVRATINRLYATGDYTDIKVDVEPDGDRWRSAS